VGAARVPASTRSTRYFADGERPGGKGRSRRARGDAREQRWRVACTRVCGTAGRRGPRGGVAGGRSRPPRRRRAGGRRGRALRPPPSQGRSPSFASLHRSPGRGRPASRRRSPPARRRRRASRPRSDRPPGAPGCSPATTCAGCPAWSLPKRTGGPSRLVVQQPPDQGRLPACSSWSRGAPLEAAEGEDHPGRPRAPWRRGVSVSLRA